MRQSASQFARLSLIAVLLLRFGVVAHAKPVPQTVDLQFVQTEIQTVLSALAATVDFNLVIGPGVEGVVDVHLSGVNWETALNTLVGAHGYRYFWNDDVLVVLADDGTNVEGLEHRVIKLKYADPALVQSALAGVLSPRGRVELVGGGPGSEQEKSTVIVLTEASHRLETVLSVIADLDVPVPQFEISVKFVETDADQDVSKGFKWPTRVGATVTNAGELATTNTNNTSSTNAQQPITSAEYPIPDGKIWKFGTLTVDQLSGYLEFLKQNGSARILSDPSVSVIENQMATMEVVTTIPIETLSRYTEGAVIQDIVDFQDLDVGITLSVRPRLNDNGIITLEVEPQVEEITGFTGPINNQRPITAKRGVKTTIRVKDGETLVIGGLVRETKFTTVSKVFLLGDIPILGALFTHRSTQKEKTDLLIFITPRIIPPIG